jgi:CHAT domain-containing protein
MAALAAIAESTNDPAAWNDLAAAAYETSLRYDAPELLADSLAACDNALARDREAREPLFNRALVLEHLGLRDDAREAWQRYLTIEGSSDWSDEARRHFRSLEPIKPFVEALDREYGRVGTPASNLTALVEHDPQGARGYGGMEVLGRWGRATLDRDPNAGRYLAVARVLGSEVARINGDRMLQGAVAAVDSAGPSPTLLALAHADYRDGLKAFQAHRPATAEPILRKAAEEFARAKSPMVLAALYYAANTVFEQGHHDEAQRQIEALLTRTPAEFPASRAQLIWELGVCYASRGDWGPALRVLEESASIFQRLGEHRYASTVRRIIAFVYDRTGDPAMAWRQRMAALQGIGTRSDVPLEKAVASIADSALLRRKWQTAVSFLTIEIGIAQRLNDPLQLADALLARAAVHNQLHDAEAARADLGAAQIAASHVSDATYRLYCDAAASRVQAMLTPLPKEAVSLLTNVIAYQTAHSDLMALPNLLLQRGRALRKAGDDAAAANDFERGIRELEIHRQSLPEGDARWGAFASADELFEEAIDLAMERGETRRAFVTAERARARALLDTYGGSPTLDYSRLPGGTVIIEYAALPSRLIIFTADRTGVSGTSIDFDRTRLGQDVNSLSIALRSGDETTGKKLAATLYETLITPVSQHLAGVTRIVFVADAATARVPFSALTSADGTYLIERQVIATAPSAAVFGSIAERPAEIPRVRSVLLIANPEPDTEADHLQYVRREAQQVAASYGSAVRLDAEQDQFDGLTRNAGNADALHFAGHAIGDETGLQPSSIVLRQKGAQRRVGVKDLAALRLRPHAVVVLAGCNTARGEQRAAEGVISVAHGFLTAGASSVIATLWSIDDEQSSILFPRLHRLLAAGMAPAEALRSVQLDCIHRRTIPPSLWAALQDIGS